MHKQSLALKEALDVVKSKRPIISPNRGFIIQLQEFEKKGTAIRSEARSAAFAWVMYKHIRTMMQYRQKVYLF